MTFAYLQQQSTADLTHFWAVKELGISLRELAKRLEISPPGVGYSVGIKVKGSLELLNKFFS